MPSYILIHVAVLLISNDISENMLEFLIFWKEQKYEK